MKWIKRYHILETTKFEVTIALVFDDKTREIMVMNRELLPELVQELTEYLGGYK